MGRRHCCKFTAHHDTEAKFASQTARGASQTKAFAIYRGPNNR